MHLERGIGALQGNVRQFQLERVIAIDINAELITAPPDQLFHQGVVARAGGNAMATEVGLTQRRQYADRHNTRAASRSHRAQLRQPGQYFPLGRGKGGFSQRVGRQVEFQIVTVELQRQPGIVGVCENVHIVIERRARRVDYIQLQLRPQRRRTLAKPRLRQQLPQTVEIVFQPCTEGLVIRLAEAGLVDVYAHGALL